MVANLTSASKNTFITNKPSTLEPSSNQSNRSQKSELFKLPIEENHLTYTDLMSFYLSLQKGTQLANVDLHGLSVQKAKEVVQYWLSKASSTGIDKIRFITGRGNHLNAKGERGVLNNNFLLWIKESACKNRIKSCDKQDGYCQFARPTPA